MSKNYKLSSLLWATALTSSLIISASGNVSLAATIGVAGSGVNSGEFVSVPRDVVVEVEGAGGNAGGAVGGDAVMVIPDQIVPLTEAAINTLDAAFAESPEAFLAAIEDIIVESPNLSDAVVDYASKLAPESRYEILNAAAAGLRTSPEREIVRVSNGNGYLLGIVGVAAAGGGLVAAMAGGGGSGTTSGASTPLTRIADPADFEDTEYNAQYGLAKVAASEAYSFGATGSGVVVGVVDTGIDANHSEFAGRIGSGGIDVVNNDFVANDELGHGTEVAGTILAARDGVGMHGVAFDATLEMAKIFDGTGSGTVTDQMRADSFDYLADHGATIINNSWGSSVPVTDFVGFESVIESAFPLWLAKLRELETNGVITVFATGNNTFAQPVLEAGLPFLFPELKDTWLTVGAVDETDTIASFSNRCGDSSDFCVVAPGVNIFMSTLGGGYTTANGTSFAAPHVAGVAAVLKSAFPHLSGAEIVELIKTTATDLGAVGVDPIYGHGLVNMFKAFNPVGTTGIPLGDVTDGGVFDTSSLTSGGAFGDITNAGVFDNANLLILDSFERGYLVPIASFARANDAAVERLEGRVVSYGQQRDLAMRDLAEGVSVGYAMREDALIGGDGEDTVPELARLSLSMNTDNGEFQLLYNEDNAASFSEALNGREAAPDLLFGGAGENPYLSLISKGFGNVFAMQGTQTGLGEGSSVVFGAFMGDHREAYDARIIATSTAARIPVSLGFGADMQLTIEAGAMHEDGAVLGLSGVGAFEMAGATTSFVGSGVSVPLGESIFGGKMRFDANFYGAMTSGEGAGGLVRGFSPILSNAFSASLTIDEVIVEDDSFGFSISQPLRVSSGDMQLYTPLARDISGGISGVTQNVSLVPTGREIDMEASYFRPLGENADISFSAAYRMEPEHNAYAADDILGVVRFNLEF